MIKGISHSMIEVNNTENEYYERALLIVRPEYASAQRAVLEREARKLLRDMDAPSAIRGKAGRLKKIIVGATLAAGGAAVGCILSSIAG